MTEPSKRTLGEDLKYLLEHPFPEKVTLEEIEEVLEGRGFATLILVIAIPFIQPIPLPGLSVLLGAALFMLGLRVALGQKARLPRFVRQRSIQKQTLHKIVEGGLKIFSKIEKLFKKRMEWALDGPYAHLIGISMMVSSVALSLPLPPVIVFSNSIPAWSLVFLSFGYLERDGLFVLLGHATGVFAWLYFLLWWEAIVAAWNAYSPRILPYLEAVLSFFSSIF